jgi:hypothetical protein
MVSLSGLKIGEIALSKNAPTVIPVKPVEVPSQLIRFADVK